MMFVRNDNLADIFAARQNARPFDLIGGGMGIPNILARYLESNPGVRGEVPTSAMPTQYDQFGDLIRGANRQQEGMMRAIASGDMTEYNRLAALHDPSRQAGAVRPVGNTMSVEQMEEFSKNNPISFAYSGTPAGSPVGGAAPAPTGGDATTADIDPSQSTLSPNFANYIYNMLAKGEAAANMPFIPYMGQRFAGVSPLQERAFQGLYGLQTPGQFGLGSSLVSQAGLGSFTAPGTASAFMSPYMQSVVDAQKREARRQADISGTQRGAKFAQAGAFGGARQAIENAEAERNLQQRMGDIETQGLQSAFDRAQQQYNAERQAQIQAGLGLGSLGTQQFGAEYQGLMGQLQGGQQQRQIAQEPLDFGYQQFQESLKYPYQQATFMQSLLQGLPLAARPYDTGQSGLSAALQGGLGGLSLYNLLSGKK